MSPGACWGWDFRVGVGADMSYRLPSSHCLLPSTTKGGTRARRRLRAAGPCTWQCRYLCLFWGGSTGLGGVRRRCAAALGRQEREARWWSKKERKLSKGMQGRAGSGGSGDRWQGRGAIQTWTGFAIGSTGPGTWYQGPGKGAGFWQRDA